MNDEFATPFDIALIAITLWLMIHQPWFAGGFGWFLLLLLSPRAYR